MRAASKGDAVIVVRPGRRYASVGTLIGLSGYAPQGRNHRVKFIRADRTWFVDDFRPDELQPYRPYRSLGELRSAAE